MSSATSGSIWYMRSLQASPKGFYILGHYQVTNGARYFEFLTSNKLLLLSDERLYKGRKQYKWTVRTWRQST